MYIREISPLLLRFAEIYPIVGITGPRQSGKTTIAKKLFPELAYVSLENLDIRSMAINDPRGLLAKYKSGAIFDEIQHTPNLLSYLQEIVDNSKLNGRFVITGSQNFALSEQISQSLSGRIGMTTLLPLSLQELNTSAEYNTSIFKGGYPRLYQNKMHPLEFFPSYIQTYLERDIRQIKNIGDLSKFQTFLKLCAGRAGQLINLSALGQDAGISHVTVRQWLTVLETSFIIYLLQPFHNNFNKRLIKMPKLYFYDTGLACSLLGLEKEQQLETYYNKGALFENLVITELVKSRFNHGLPSNMFFWRDQSGCEVDVIAEWGAELKAIEIKSSSTFQASDIKNLNQFSKLSNTASKYVVYAGDEQHNYLGTNIVSIKDLPVIFKP